MKKLSAQSKAKRHESKGDKLISKGKINEALKEYKKSLNALPTPEILDKLTDAKHSIKGEWKKDDFAESLFWTMQKQELIHPPIKQVHARLTPEWKKATKYAMQMLFTDDEKSRSDIIEKLVQMGEIATRALIGVLLDLKSATMQPNKGP